MTTHTSNVFYHSLILATLMLSVNAYAVNLTAQSKAEIRGEDPGLNVKFSSVLDMSSLISR